MLTVPRPIPWSEDYIGDLTQAGTLIVRIDSVQRTDPAGELQVRTWRALRGAESTDNGNAGLEMAIIRKVKLQEHRAGKRCSFDDIEPRVNAISFDQEMLVVEPAKRPDRRERPIESASAVRFTRTRPNGDHTRVDDRRPHRQHMGAALRRIFRESAAPIPR